MAFTHEQQIDARGQVRSVQTLSAVLPTPWQDPANAGQLYFECLRRWGRPLLQVRTHQDGGVELRALGLLLLAFAAPEVAADPAGGGGRIRYPIDRGVAVQRGGQGLGYLEMSFAPGQVRLAVEGYYARLVGPRRNPLRVAVYLLTQSALHVLIARAYLPVLARSLTTAQKG